MSDRKTTTTDRKQAPALDKQLLEIVFEWLDRLQEAEVEHLEAELDRASFESFPASDPVSPSMGSQSGSKIRIDCEVGPDRLVLSRGLRTDDPTGPEVRGEPDEIVEGETPSGVRVRIEIRSAPGEEDEATAENLEIPPEHASFDAKSTRTTKERRR